ncbi:MAG: hypothetical protein R3B81_01675 [bacterium]
MRATVAIFLILVAVDADAQLINITSPTSSSSWLLNSHQEITWFSLGTSGFVAIELYKGGQYLGTINSGTSDDGSFVWTVNPMYQDSPNNFIHTPNGTSVTHTWNLQEYPQDLYDCADYQIRVYDIFDSFIEDYSGQFTLDQNTIESQDADALDLWQVFGWNVSYDAPSSRQYNCHGWAWEKSEGGQTVWIGVNIGDGGEEDAEDVYWTDGSYDEVSIDPWTATASNAPKINYPDPVTGNHSGNMTGTPGVVQSKWGPYPLCTHPWTEVPYTYNNWAHYTPQDGPNTAASVQAFKVESGVASWRAERQVNVGTWSVLSTDDLSAEWDTLCGAIPYNVGGGYSARVPEAEYYRLIERETTGRVLTHQTVSSRSVVAPAPPSPGVSLEERARRIDARRAYLQSVIDSLPPSSISSGETIVCYTTSGSPPIT